MNEADVNMSKGRKGTTARAPGSPKPDIFVHATRPTKTILLVDDQDDTRITTKLFLSTFGYVVDSVRSAEEALSLFNSSIHDVVISDNSMPGMTGAEMAHVIKLRSPATPVIMFTGLSPEDHSCLDVVIEKPAHLLALKEAVSRILMQSES